MKIPTLSRLSTNLHVRDYQPSDMDQCLSIYRSNLAEFLPDAIELFIDHLSHPYSYYLVVETNASIVACGGLDVRGDKNHADFTFGMVQRNLHRCGLGSLLTLTRLALLDGEYDPALVELETTLTMEPFYQRFGFERLSYPEHLYPGGSYYVSMGLGLTMEDRNRIREYLVTLPVSLNVEFPCV